uniref:Family with sequence similarity 49 member A, like n=1 Tax=Gasterosteus aculeatus aculeatus TaxID=481459 RepID=A0AAQ4QQC9_GASAC
ESLSREDAEEATRGPPPFFFSTAFSLLSPSVPSPPRSIPRPATVAFRPPRLLSPAPVCVSPLTPPPRREGRKKQQSEASSSPSLHAQPVVAAADAVTTVRSRQALVDAVKCSSGTNTSEDAQPTEAETAVWNQVSAVLEEAHGILAELQSYNGAGQEIREAIQNPGDLALQEKAWNAVCPLVAKLKRFYEFSLRLENALRSLLEALTSPPYAPMQHLEREQALAKQFAEILHFTLSFDELKMTNPAIQNDFSYYRRTISRNRLNNQQLEAENEVNNEMANRMSLFYAEATPMLKTLSNATTKFVSENKTLPIEDTTDCLSTMACVCRVMLETPEYRCRFTNTDTMLFCMRVMVGVIILYDHVHPVGAFAKTSKIDMKGCIKVLKEQPSNSVEGLLNALRYTTRHLNDDSTSKQIRALLQ